MMKALIVSDSHSSVKELQQLKEKYEGKVDIMIHCGDSELTPAHEELQGFRVVKGNCDYANWTFSRIRCGINRGRFIY